MTVFCPTGAKQQRLEFHSPWVSFPEKYVTCHKADQNLGFLRNVYVNIYITINISIHPFDFSHVIVFLFLMLVNVVSEIIVSSWHSRPGTELHSSTLARWHHGEWSVLPCPMGFGPSHCFTLALWLMKYQWAWLEEAFKCACTIWLILSLPCDLSWEEQACVVDGPMRHEQTCGPVNTLAVQSQTQHSPNELTDPWKGKSAFLMESHWDIEAVTWQKLIQETTGAVLNLGWPTERP